MSTLSQDLMYLILQFFGEEGLSDTIHSLERETGLYFNMDYFEETILSGNWSEAESYLSGFAKLGDDAYSTKIYFEIRKQAFFEALDSKDRVKAFEILMKDLKVFQPRYEDLFKEMVLLLALDDIREHPLLASYGDVKSARKAKMEELKKVIEASPLIRDKLNFPNFGGQRLRCVINQGLNWQHIKCKNPKANPVIKTLLTDHICQPCDDAPLAESSENSLLAHAENHETTSLPDESINSSPSTVTYPNGLPTVTEVQEISDNFSNALEASEEEAVPSIYADVPRTVALMLNEESSPTSMDFHPVDPTLLLVGNSAGDTTLWDVSNGVKLFFRKFQVWDIGAFSLAFKAALDVDQNVYANCLRWSPKGSLFGIGYSKHVVQLYSYLGDSDIQRRFELDAHEGCINDLAFASPCGQLVVITCGDDKTIKVWDTVTGDKKFTFEGHEAPVYSLHPHKKGSICFLFSTSVDGKLKAWLYHDMGAKVHYDTPGLGCTRLRYNADGQRLFSCGTNKNGETFLVEWNESEGSIKRNYHGVHSCSPSTVQFDTFKNQILAAGDDHVIKFWHMDGNRVLEVVDAGGELPVTPSFCFNEEETLMAVIANTNKIKILATDHGLRWFQTTEENCVNPSKDTLQTVEKIATDRASTAGDVELTEICAVENGELKEVENEKSLLAGEFKDKAKDTVLNLFEFDRPSHFRSLKLSDARADKISKLAYTNSGNAILGLALNGSHFFWKWPSDKLNQTGKATTKVHPRLCDQHVNNGELMSNSLVDGDAKRAVPCFALTKHDSYLLSSSGRGISLYNMVTFKKISTMLPAPPAATSMAIYPEDSNIIAIGTDNAIIVIYNVRLRKIIAKLESHTKRVTGLAFSSIQKILISSGADEQITVWGVDEWIEQKSTLLQSPRGPKFERGDSDTRVQIHQDQVHFLVVHWTHLAIYEAEDLECDNQWNVSIEGSPISHATFSCDSRAIYASFLNGSIAMFDASTLQMKCQIHPYAYLPCSSRLNWPDYPVVIAAHPHKATQFAVGLGNGEVYVLEPPEDQTNWEFGSIY